MKLDSLGVALTSCAGYDEQQLVQSIESVIAPLSGLPNLHSCHVVLKPNLITSKFGTLPCTEGAFMVAAACWFVDHGAVVSIGDSPAFGTATSILKVLGVADTLLGMGVQITDFKRLETVRLSGGGTAGLAIDAMECDLLVNLPRVKAHAQTRVSLAVKNCFGCLGGMRKPWWHMAYGDKGGCKHGDFSDRLVQILTPLADCLTLVDGVTAMHVSGPIHGAAYPLGLVAASTNPVAVDRALLAVLSIEPELSPLMSASKRAGIPGTELSSLSFPLAEVEKLQVNDFIVPGQLNPIRFNPFRFIKNNLRRIVLQP